MYCGRRERERERESAGSVVEKGVLEIVGVWGRWGRGECQSYFETVRRSKVRENSV
jgi:hypothetical protein